MQSILGPKKYNAAQPTARKYSEILNLTQNDSQLNYKIIIKNADGKDHPIKTCNQTNFFQKLICNIQNIPNTLYVQIYRVQSLEIRNNNVVIIPSTQINKNTYLYEATLKLSQINNLAISVLGATSSYVTIEIQKPLTPADTTPPLITFNLKSNTTINTNSGLITITDQSNTTTTITDNGQLVLTSTNKTINYTLSDGGHNLIIASTDAFGNKSTNYIVSQLVVDTKPAILAQDLKSNYVVAQLPYLQTITITSNEALQSLQINDFSLIQTGLNTYTYVAQFDAAGIKRFNLKATDLAGNIANQSMSTTIVVDNTPPTIATNAVPAVTAESSFNLNIAITDASTTQTEILVNQISQLKTTNQNIANTLNLPNDGTYDIKIISTDYAGNASVKTLSLTKDTKPLYVNIISPVNQSVLNSNIIEIRAKANKLLSVAKINGQIVQLSDDQVSLKYNLQSLSENTVSILIEVTDITGASAQQSVSVQIKPSSLPSWTYEECPVVQ